MHLLDVNVWLALAFDSHRHHSSAVDWFDQAADRSSCFCRMTQLSFLRLSTTPQVMTENALTLADAWRAYDCLYQDPRVVYAEEPAGLEEAWRRLTQHASFSPKIWADAYLTAFALVADLQVVTFDQGFANYVDLKYTLLH